MTGERIRWEGVGSGGLLVAFCDSSVAWRAREATGFVREGRRRARLWCLSAVPFVAVLWLGPRLPIWGARLAWRLFGVGSPPMTRGEALARASARGGGEGFGPCRIAEEGAWYIIRPPANIRGAAYHASVHAFTGEVRFPSGIQR